MIEANRYKLGLFVVIGILLLTVGLFLTGLRQMFEPTILVTTTFSESVQGIEKGSPVKFSGVPVGKVTHVSMRPSEKIVLVDIEINTRAFAVDPNSPNFIFYSQKRFRDELDRGLRCQMEFLGITGLKYIEIDYFAKDATDTSYTAEPANLPANVFYLPAHPSLLSGIKTSVVDLLASVQYTINSINKIDFDEVNNISTESRQTLQTLREVLLDKSPRIDSTLNSITDGAEAISKFAHALDSHVDNIDLKTQLSNVDSALNALRDAANAIATSSVRGVTDFSSLVNELESSIRLFNQVLREIDENPAILIRGRYNPPAGEIEKPTR